jgi:methionyl-tRNA formyltransferase
MAELRFAFAGDRDISVWVLDHLLQQGHRPLALLVSGPERASHADALRSRCDFLGADRVVQGKQFGTPEGVDMLSRLDLDFILGIHFPYLVPERVLAIPRQGVLNLHPAYLPYNRGWHTPSWALLDGTPAGATLHFMAPEVDAGDIVHQKRLEVSAADTAHTLYERLKRLELEVFVEAWPRLVAGDFGRIPQDSAAATTHTRAQLFAESIQRIDLAEAVPAGDLLRRLRALTTSRIDEAAYFEADGRRYRVQVRIEEENGRRGETVGTPESEAAP